MAFAGRIALVLALAVALYGIAASVYGARRGRRDWVDSGRRSVYCLAAVLTVAMAILEVAFIRNDFAYNTVANTSSTTTPLLYRAAAMWSSQEGSLLLWVWLLSIWSSVATFITRNRLRDIVPYATSVLLGTFTTFSTWMLESERLARSQRVWLAAINLVASLVAGVGAIALGRLVG